jgi:hypothetical protein
MTAMGYRPRLPHKHRQCKGDHTEPLTNYVVWPFQSCDRIIQVILSRNTSRLRPGITVLIISQQWACKSLFLALHWYRSSRESHYWSVAQKQPHSLKTEKRILQFTIWKCLRDGFHSDAGWSLPRAEHQPCSRRNEAAGDCMRGQVKRPWPVVTGEQQRDSICVQIIISEHLQQ